MGPLTLEGPGNPPLPRGALPLGERCAKSCQYVFRERSLHAENLVPSIVLNFFSYRIYIYIYIYIYTQTDRETQTVTSSVVDG